MGMLSYSRKEGLQQGEAPVWAVAGAGQIASLLSNQGIDTKVRDVFYAGRDFSKWRVQSALRRPSLIKWPPI